MTAPAEWAILVASHTGKTVPVSLLANINATMSGRTVAARRANRRMSIWPAPETGNRSLTKPDASSCSQTARTAGCSTADVITVLPAGRCLDATPFSARLTASVAQLVKTISLESALIRAAT